MKRCLFEQDGDERLQWNFVFRRQIVNEQEWVCSEYRPFWSFYLVGVDASDSATRIVSAPHSVTSAREER
jgi:hypothetical protein